jgi:uroporphyrinogen decarboxylase
MLSTAPDFNRVITTLNHAEPDRVPLIEAAIDYSIMGRFLGRPVRDDDVAAQVAFWSQAGYDYIPLTVGMMAPGAVTQDSQISKTIRDVLVKDEFDRSRDESWNLERRSFIHTEEDFERFPWAEAGNLDLSKFDAVCGHLPAGMRVIALSGKIFTLSWLLMGFENFALQSVLNPGFVRRVIEQVARIQLEGLRRVSRLPYVAAAWAVDDLAFGSGPMISPRALRQLIFPWYEEFGRICREAGLYFFFHSDGLLWELIDDLVHVGVQALHPIDPTCMDIEEVKRREGGRLCLLGNISNELLAVGTSEEVIALTRRRLRDIGPGGGYCLGSGNSVPDWAGFENYMAMRETVLGCGGYPIRIA